MPRIALETVQQLDARLEQQLRQEFRQYQVLKARLKALETETEKKRQLLIKLRRESGLDEIDLDGFAVALVNGKRHFDRREFVRLGGDLKVYDAAMVPGERQERVTLPGEKHETKTSAE